MLILSADNKHASGASGEAGFSLVELLAVLAIMSLMVSAVVMSIPSGPSALDRSSQAMVDVIQDRLEKAALAGEMRALRLSETELVLLRDAGSVLVADATVSWPDNVRVSARQGETALELGADDAPLIWVEPYGQVPALDITLRGARETFILSFDDEGRLTRDTQ